MGQPIPVPLVEAMKTILALIILHAGVGCVLYVIAGPLWGNLARKSYESRMGMGGRWFMSGRLSDFEYWRRHQRRWCYFALPMVCLVYVGAMKDILSPAQGKKGREHDCTAAHKSTGKRAEPCAQGTRATVNAAPTGESTPGSP